MRTCICVAAIALLCGSALADCPEPTTGELAAAINEQIDQHEDILFSTKKLYARSQNEDWPYKGVNPGTKLSKVRMYVIAALEDLQIIKVHNVTRGRFKISRHKGPLNFKSEYDPGSGWLQIRATTTVNVDQIDNIDLYEIAGEKVAVVDARMKVTETPELQTLVLLLHKLTKADDPLPACFPQDGKLDGYRREKISLYQDENCKWIWQLSDLSVSGGSPLCTDSVLQDIDAMYREEKQVTAGERGDFIYGKKLEQDKLPTSDQSGVGNGTKKKTKKQIYSKVPSDN